MWNVPGQKRDSPNGHHPSAQNSGGTANLRPFRPGQSGNPGGRPKGLATYIREQTDDGRELVDVVLAVLRNGRSGARLRLEAATWLADRGWGRPVQSHELSGAGGEAMTFTLRLTERREDDDA